MKAADHRETAKRVRRLTAAEEISLARRVRAGDQTARTRMIEANLRLVGAIAQRGPWAGCGIDVEDLIQEGIVGLDRAVDKFDPDRGLRFSTMATNWIKAAIRRAVEDKGRTIRVPNHAIRQAVAVDRCRQDLELRLGRTASDHEVGAELGIPAAKAAALSLSMLDVFSLDHPVSDLVDTPVLDVIQDRTTPSAFDEMVGRMDRWAIQNLLGVLTQRERAVIEYRYGFADGQVHSQRQTAAELGWSQSGVAHMEARAMRKMRAALDLDMEEAA